MSTVRTCPHCGEAIDGFTESEDSSLSRSLQEISKVLKGYRASREDRKRADVLREEVAKLKSAQPAQDTLRTLSDENIEQVQEEFEREMRKTFGDEHFIRIEHPFDGVYYRSTTMQRAWRGYLLGLAALAAAQEAK